MFLKLNYSSKTGAEGAHACALEQPPATVCINLKLK